MKKSKILMVSTRLPFPLNSGVRLKNFHLAKAYRDLGYAVDLLFIGFEDRNMLDPNKQLEKVFDRIYEYRISRFSMVLNLILALFKSEPFQCAIYNNKSARIWISENSNKYKFIQFMLIRTYYFSCNLPISKKIIDMADILSNTFAEYSKKNTNFLMRCLLYRESQVLKKFENNVLSDPCNKTLFNYNEVKNLKEKYNIHHVIHGTDKTRVTRISKRNTNNYLRIGFVGNLSYSPNVEMVFYILFCLSQADFKWKLSVVGADPTESFQKALLNNRNVTIISNAIDITKEICKFDVLFSPVLSGGGIQNKILESLSLGVPVLTNSKGASAFIPSVQKHLLVGEQVNEQLKILKDLLDGNRSTTRTKLRQIMRKNYDWQNSAKSYLKVFK